MKKYNINHLKKLINAGFNCFIGNFNQFVLVGKNDFEGIDKIDKFCLKEILKNSFGIDTDIIRITPDLDGAKFLNNDLK